MSRSAFDKIAAGLNAAVAFATDEADLAGYRTHVPEEIDVKALRLRLKMTQTAFAERFGFSPARIRDWEHGRSHPDGAVRAYLIVIEREPQAVARALNAGR